MTKLHELNELGQSVWMDYIHREMLGEQGELARLVGQGVRGVTSNPTIFEKAVATNAYDDQIQEIIAGDGDTRPEAVFEELALRDIRGAADVLLPVYESSDGRDGFVSLEVAPDLGYDTDGTIEAARRLWTRADRPNVLIKVPATDEGVPAVEELIAAGINVNITLMFSLADYEAVSHAYLRGLERTSDPSRIASVASFFVSRVDTKTDEALDKVGTGAAMELRGRIAIANAKLAYRRYQEIFEGGTFADLAARGARPQRVLWASTSTKNPEYPDTMYVDELIGPNTVNTMPPQTIEAFLDHGSLAPTLTKGVDVAEQQIAGLADLGVSYDEITRELQTEGVQAFADSMTDLYTTIAEKIRTLES